MDQSRVAIECVNLTELIGYAFRFSPERVTGPNWIAGLDSPRFDIAAKLPQAASPNQVPEMLQALLVDRFKLAIHRGTTIQVINALVAAKGGLKMREAVSQTSASPPAVAADAGAASSVVDFFGSVLTSMTPNGDGSGYITTFSNPRMGVVRETDDVPNRIQRWEASNITLEGLADLLDNVAPMSLPVVDMTGLKGRYQMSLEVSLKDLFGAPPSLPNADPHAATENAHLDLDEMVLQSFNDGLRKLGLRVERRKEPIETLIVDHVEKSPTEN
jgi:uncharacterized protein (TIGR03435 family)